MVCVGTTVLTVRAIALMDLKLDYRAIGTVGEGIRKVRCIRRWTACKEAEWLVSEVSLKSGVGETSVFCGIIFMETKKSKKRIRCDGETYIATLGMQKSKGEIIVMSRPTTAHFVLHLDSGANFRIWVVGFNEATGTHSLCRGNFIPKGRYAFHVATWASFLLSVLRWVWMIQMSEKGYSKYSTHFFKNSTDHSDEMPNSCKSLFPIVTNI